MNIGIVTTWFERGAAYVSKQFKEGLEDGENNVYIYARGGEMYAKNDIKWDGPDVTWGRMLPVPITTIVDLNHFKNWIIDNKLEIVFFNEQHWWPPIILCKKLGVKTGAYIDYYTPKTVSFFKVYDFLICNTKRHFEVFKWHPQCNYVPWGTDLSIFKPDNYELKEENKVVFFHSCGMSPMRKGTDLLLDAFYKLNCKEAKLIIHSQVDLRIKLPHHKGIIDHLIEIGKLEYLNKTVSAPGLYHLGDVYVYPSRLDGIGLTIAEALASGLPVLVSDNPPMNEFIDGTQGIGINIQGFKKREDNYYWEQCEIDVDDLVSKLKWFIHNRENLKDMKINSRKYSEQNLNWKANFNIIKSVFRNSVRYHEIDYRDVLKYEIEKIEKYTELSPYFYTIEDIYELTKNKKIIMFGTSTASLTINKKLNLEINYYVDNDHKKINTIFLGKRVEHPDMLYKEKSNDFIILISSSYYFEIAKQLLDMGFKENKDFIWLTEKNLIQTHNSILSKKSVTIRSILDEIKNL